MDHARKCCSRRLVGKGAEESILQLQFQGIGEQITPESVVPRDWLAKEPRNPLCSFSSKGLVSGSRQKVLFQVIGWQRSREIHFAGSVPRDW